MKFIYAICLVLTMNTFADCQSKKTKITVLGMCQSLAPEKIGQTITLKIVVDQSKCDPQTGYISMEDRLYHLEQALKTKNISFNEFERSWDSKLVGTIQTDIYSYFGTTEAIADIITIAQNQEIQITKVRDKRKDKKLEDQDPSAICALQDAQARAEYLAKQMGYSNCDLISIDDDTSIAGISSWRYMSETIPMKDILLGASSYSIVGHFEVY